jgi:rhodanese-related sulfurtransferase
MARTRFAILTALLGLAMVGAAEIPTQEDAPRMTKEDLKALLGSPDLVVLDLRLEEQWKFSNRKILGAVHENPTVPDTWMDKYPKEKTLVLYCA